LKDLLAHGDQTRFAQVAAVLMQCIADEQDSGKMKQTIKVQQFLFSKVPDLKVKMADLFVTLLLQIETKTQEC
jgi:hypothetical protein